MVREEQKNESMVNIIKGLFVSVILLAALLFIFNAVLNNPQNPQKEKMRDDTIADTTSKDKIWDQEDLDRQKRELDALREKANVEYSKENLDKQRKELEKMKNKAEM